MVGWQTADSRWQIAEFVIPQISALKFMRSSKMGAHNIPGSQIKRDDAKGVS